MAMERVDLSEAQKPTKSDHEHAQPSNIARSDASNDASAPKRNTISPKPQQTIANTGGEAHEGTGSAGELPCRTKPTSDQPIDGNGPKGDAESDQGDGDDESPTTDAVVQLEQGQQKKKKKNKSKSRAGKAARKVTGFEEFYADGPTTPAAAAEDLENYAKHVPFTARIEEAIQRYRARRRFDSIKQHLFDRYLFLGGIDSSQRQFTGADPADIKGASSAAEVVQMTTNTVIHSGTSSTKFYDPTRAEHWVVDFEAIVQGYLSREVPLNIVGGDEMNQTAAGIVKNFLNYLIQHDVCPEYRAEIDKARALCDFAPEELDHASGLQPLLPGAFNSAATFLFCEWGAQKLVDADDDPTLSQSEDHLWNHLQLVTFRFTVTYWFNDEKLGQLAGQEDPRKIQVVQSSVKSYEIVSVKRPQKSMAIQAEEGFAPTAYAGKVKAVGKVYLRPAVLEHDMCNLPRPDEVDLTDKPTEIFYFEEEILSKFHVGMKMKVVVCDLNIGISFIKECLELRVSFDKILPQSLMTGWKEPRPNERPAPSADRPDLDDEAADVVEVD